MQKLTEGRASKVALEQFLQTCAAENPNRRLRLMALEDRVSMRVDRADFDDLVTLVTQAPTWEKERLPGIRTLLRAIAEGKPDAPDQILVRWTWRLARATRKVQDRRASGEFPEAKRLLGALANSRGHRHEENVAKLVRTALEQPLHVGAALLASAEGYTPRATKLIDEAREQLGTVQEVALALSENLPAPKQQPSRNRRRRRRKKKVAVAGVQVEGAEVTTEPQPSEDGASPAGGDAPAAETPAGDAQSTERRRAEAQAQTPPQAGPRSRDAGRRHRSGGRARGAHRAGRARPGRGRRADPLALDLLRPHAVEDLPKVTAAHREVGTRDVPATRDAELVPDCIGVRPRGTR